MIFVSAVLSLLCPKRNVFVEKELLYQGLTLKLTFLIDVNTWIIISKKLGILEVLVVNITRSVDVGNLKDILPSSANLSGEMGPQLFL